MATTTKPRVKLPPPPHVKGLSGAPYHVMTVETLLNIGAYHLGRRCFSQREAEQMADVLTMDGATVVVLVEVEAVDMPYRRHQRIASTAAHKGRS